MTHCVASCGRPRTWGFLLPLQDRLSPLLLQRERTEVVGDGRGGVSAAQPSCWPSLCAPGAPGLLLEVRRDGEVHARACARADGVRLNGEALPRDRETPLQHGDCLHLHDGRSHYVFVHRQYSDFFKGSLDALSRYIVGHRISGNFGSVFALFDTKMRYQQKVVKIVTPKSENALKYVEREGKILMSVKHPCVVKTFSVTQVGVQCFLVMEFMAGGDLSHFVNNKRLLSEAQTKLIFFQLALAVEYLHEKNVCHRDLKPANILLQRRDPYTLIKVTDFGLSKNQRDDSDLQTIAGTGPYLAPEILTDDTYTGAVDVWSMGVILFYSLSGTLPFKNTHKAVLENLMVTYNPAIWSSVSSDAEALVKSMLQKMANSRPAVFRVINCAWLSDSGMREDVFRLTGLKFPIHLAKYSLFPFR